MCGVKLKRILTETEYGVVWEISILWDTRVQKRDPNLTIKVHVGNQTNGTFPPESECSVYFENCFTLPRTKNGSQNFEKNFRRLCEASNYDVSVFYSKYDPSLIILQINIICHEICQHKYQINLFLSNKFILSPL